MHTCGCSLAPTWTPREGGAQNPDPDSIRDPHTPAKSVSWPFLKPGPRTGDFLPSISLKSPSSRSQTECAKNQGK
ncbi:unnamed protein product [Staurois parvus]|uniref:Prolactin receptor n=1 Tax=Staurois parvus TaxID=386267 RepID=A0ABN9ANJ8_9NEOB|nr:unnamed protein product [Staurois parvus]